MKVIVSDYSGFYESIHTEETVCMLFIKIKYHFFKKGYKVWSFPTYKMVRWWAKITGRTMFYEGPNVHFEKYIKGSDQITRWSPYDNFI